MKNHTIKSTNVILMVRNKVKEHTIKSTNVILMVQGESNG
jgi:hypothetical protein